MGYNPKWCAEPVPYVIFNSFVLVVLDGQAVAAGLGGRTLAAALAALCLNHKHFGGGLPDLLLMRAVRTTTAVKSPTTTIKSTTTTMITTSAEGSPMMEGVGRGNTVVESTATAEAAIVGNYTETSTVGVVFYHLECRVVPAIVQVSLFSVVR